MKKKQNLRLQKNDFFFIAALILLTALNLTNSKTVGIIIAFGYTIVMIIMLYLAFFTIPLRQINRLLFFIFLSLLIPLIFSEFHAGFTERYFVKEELFFSRVFNKYFFSGIIFLGSAYAFFKYWNSLRTKKNESVEDSTEKNLFKPKVVDTNVIIDGRITDIISIGFLEGSILIPKYIIKELQTLSDSHDHMKRSRGRRGLDVLNKIQNELKFPVQIVDKDYPEFRDADEKLIAYAKEFNAVIMTNDYNLNKLAELNSIRVLNLNDLANALKPMMLPGDSIEIPIVKEGKESHQGVGYLNDGTMIVIDHAIKNMNQKIKAVITSAIQTSAGRMFFGKKPEDLK